MKMLAFARRNMRELIRDKATVIACLAFPLGILLLLTVIQSNIPVPLFEPDSLVPGIAVFGLSFITLFSSTVISKDRSTSFMLRLLVSPMSAADFILGYTLPALPLALAQTAVCYLAGLALGLTPTLRIIPAVLLTLPAAIFFASFGLLCGTLLNDRQVGGVCGALLTNLAALLSGAWFDPAMAGSAFEAAARALPFYNATIVGRCALSGTLSQAWAELSVVSVYAVLTALAASALFASRIKSDSF